MNFTNCRFFVAFSLSFTALAQSTASIQGYSLDSATGKPVPGAVVIASRTTTPAARGVATSSNDGSFQIPSLPAGTYNLCAQVPGDGYLATCHWGNTATTVTLAAGQKLTATKLGLKSGSILKIHLDDPGKLLNQKTKKGYAPHLVMGVWSGGMFYPAHVAAKTAVAADYQVTIPFDTSLKFSIQSMSLGLGNANKTALAGNSDQQSFQHASAEPTHVSYSYSILSALQ